MLVNNVLPNQIMGKNLYFFNLASSSSKTVVTLQHILLAHCPQFYIQLVFKAPLCITLTISDQKNREW